MSQEIFFKRSIKRGVLGKTLYTTAQKWRWRQWKTAFARKDFIFRTFSFRVFITISKYYSLPSISPKDEMKYSITFIGGKYFSVVSINV